MYEKTARGEVEETSAHLHWYTSIN